MNPTKFFLTGIALATVIGCGILRFRADVPYWFLLFLALLVTIFCGVVFLPRIAKPVKYKPSPNPDAQDLQMPKAGTRRWARMMYHNGLIDIEELNRYYQSHPEEG